MSHPHLVILGGGFGGLALAQALSRAPLRITLVDKRNHHLFQPLLYQVATAALAPGDIAEPLRRVFKGQRNLEVRLAEATDIDLEGRRVILSDGEIAYDMLVLATGSTHHYFGNDEKWAPHAPGLKTIGDALEIRRRILTAFERAEWSEDEDDRRKLLTFVVVGGGPTGVEMAGAIREIALRTLRREFRHVAPEEDARVILVEAMDHVLGAYPDPLPGKARKQLESLGVEVLTGDLVEDVSDEGVTVGGERIEAGTIVWAAGVKSSPLAEALGVELHRSGRVPVEPDLSIQGHPEAFVIGDLAYLEQDGEPLPGLAPVAQQMGRHLGRQIKRGLRGRSRKPFRYTDLGSMATIGRSKAIAKLPGVRLSGFVAWLIWVFIHLMALVGFRNRLVVFLKWAWAWFTFERSSRLVWQGESHEPWNRVPGEQPRPQAPSREVA